MNDRGYSLKGLSGGTIGAVVFLGCFSFLVRRRPIWVGGVDRSEQSLDLFSQWLAAKKTAGIQLAVMDMWRAFEASTVPAYPVDTTNHKG